LFIFWMNICPAVFLLPPPLRIPEKNRIVAALLNSC
jgi:hypothetical protein